ncbi:MAG TPA: SemiSWEET family transporter [Caulobacteraceae bacterium]|jgi:MtN3 and saliva related transmembrane protein|nr:SemiSWEET family transporter [Caulobacteraceae bacterium]
MSSQVIVEIVGAGAALCSTASFVPQLVKLVRERAAEAVSAPMFALTVAAFALWSVYGLTLRSWPLAASNLVSLVLSAAILRLKLRYRARDQAPAGAAPR